VTYRQLSSLETVISGRDPETAQSARSSLADWKSNLFSRVDLQLTGIVIRIIGKSGRVFVCTVSEYRTSAMCCQCHSRLKPRSRSMVCPVPICPDKRSQQFNTDHGTHSGWMRNRDGNAGHNMANATIHWLRTFRWPVALSRKTEKPIIEQ